jgi:hypothetical protein
MFKRVLVSLAAFWICSSCTKKPPADAFCTYEPLPQTTDAAAGQGAIQILAPTDEYFYVFDAAGKQLSYGSMNRALAIKPGQYQVKVNKSPHAVVVQAKTLTKCNAGTLLVSGSTDEYYYVFDGSKTQLAYQKLEHPLAFFPGDYSVSVNKTSASANLKPGATTNLKAGILNMQGSTDEYYYVFDGAGTQLAYNKLSKALSFFAGPLTIKVNATSAPVNITPAGLTEARTGALVVQGTTDEYYYVFDSLGNQLAYNKLSQPLSFLPGSYSVKVNKSPMPVAVEAGRSNEYPTASLTVKASGDDYYYVLDPNGTQLGYAKVNQPISFVAGKYSVKLGKETRPVTLVAGQPMIMNW